MSVKVYNNPGNPPPPESEDCLYLNIYAPLDASPSNKKVVMVWFIGGYLLFGTGSIALYDGSSFAAFQDVIIVTFNFRWAKVQCRCLLNRLLIDLFD